MAKKETKKAKVETKKVEEKKELLDLNEDISTVAKFSISEIKMKNDWRWKVKMLVHAILPDTHHDYSIKLEFDDAPFLKTIEQLEKDAAELAQYPTMFPDVDRRTIKELDSKVAKTRAEMEKLRSDCSDIEFVAQSEEIKYSGGDTSLLFKILDSVIQPLNEQKYRLTDYRAILTPIYKGIK